MALINCPNCGKEVSDQAASCIHCGAEIPTPKPEEVDEGPARCPECGTEIQGDEEACQNCGCPLKPITQESEGAKPEQSENSVVQPANAETSAPQKVKNRTLLVVIAIAVVAIAAVAIGFAFNAHQEQVKQEQEAAAAQAAAEKAAADKKAAYNQYIDDMTKSMTLMIAGAAQAETLGNTVRNVWNSAIFEGSPDAWDEEIRAYYSGDFNEALASLFADPNTVQTVSEIEANQDAVNDLYKKLQNPPDGLANAYSAYEEMHDAYVKLTKLAINPSGSLQSYGTEFREADNDCVDAFEKLKARIPNKK